MDILKSIEEAVVSRSVEEVKTLTQTALDKNVPPTDILNKGLLKGLETIGGAPIDQKFSDMIGADGFAPDPPSGVKKVMTWLGKA